MILNTITLHNFMSYGDSSLDLSSFSVACLSGFNGAGKSAILDAVTWCLWECARSSSDELIRTGEQSMWVDVIFQLDQPTYRVRRSRQRSMGKPGSKVTSKGSLDFQIWQGGDYLPGKNGQNVGKWVSLNGSSVRDTQSRITEVLRMDYDTFINSAYLRQGRADEFTMRAPGERKQLLSEILGLNYFDQLHELSKDEARSRKSKIEVLQSTLAEGGVVEGKITALREEHATSEKHLEAMRKERTAILERTRKADIVLSDLRTIESRVEPTTQRLSELEEDIAPLTAIVEKSSEKLSILREAMQASDDIQRKALRFKEVRTKVEELDQISLQRQEFETRTLELKSIVATARGRLEVELDHLQSQLKTLNSNKAKLDSDLEGKDKFDTEYRAYRRLIAEESELSHKQEAYSQLSGRAEQLHTLVVEERLHLEAELEQKTELLSELESLIKGRQSLLDERDDIERQTKELDKLEIDFEIIEETGIKLKQQIDALEMEVEQIKSEQLQNDQKAKELIDGKSLTMCPLCASPVVDRASVLSRYKQANENLNAKVSDLESQKYDLEQKRIDLRQRYIDIKRKLDGRKRLDVRIGEFNARLAAIERADNNCAKLRTECTELAARLEQQRYAEIERESLVAVKAEMHKLDFDPIIYSSLQSQLRAQRHVDYRYQQMKRAQAEVATLHAEIPQLEAKIENIQRTLSTDYFAAEHEAEMLELRQKLSAFPYDRLEHQTWKQELAELLPFVERFKDAHQAIEDIPTIEKELTLAQEKLAVKTAQQLELQGSIKLWTEKLANMSSLQEQRTLDQDRLLELDPLIQQSERETTILDVQLQQLESQSATFEKQRQSIDTLIAEMNDYMLLSDAFGKKGIQAVIIENAVPEIEAEANNILSKLSENQMHVALVTQQKNKQGTVNETLDIVIADDQGTRNYELYSGGEAFKINFAIRVALSRLLSRRAGAKLQTLFIDEGFGSQDEVSRGRLVKAINAIKSDFAKILIVTHIAEVKDLFPVQIHVQKDNGVSRMSLVHSF